MTDVVAVARVRAAEAKQALDSLTEVAAPMIVQLELAQGRFSLTVHGESGHWWATASVKAADGTEGSAPATSVIVSRMLIREAIDSEALLNPERDCALLILGGEVVRYGTYAVAQAPDAEMPLPPLLDQDAPAESGLAVERGATAPCACEAAPVCSSCRKVSPNVSSLPRSRRSISTRSATPTTPASQPAPRAGPISS